MNWVAIGSIATARGVIFVGWQIWQTRKQNITAFEDEMSRQYREIPKTIPVEALLGEELSKEELEDAENGIYHYLDLSNEEVFLRQNGRVSSETWKSCVMASSRISDDGPSRKCGEQSSQRSPTTSWNFRR